MKSIPILKLIFIYNANSGKLNSMLDSARKVLRPATYDCHLCAITFGVFTENTIWKKFREQSATELLFLHKDEFMKQYASKFGHKFTFPIILAETDQDLEVFVGTKELMAIENSEELVQIMTKRLTQLAGQIN